MGAALSLILIIGGLFLSGVGIAWYVLNKRKNPPPAKSPWYILALIILGMVISVAGLVILAMGPKKKPPTPSKSANYAAPVPSFPAAPAQPYMPAAPTQLPQAYVPPGR